MKYRGEKQAFFESPMRALQLMSALVAGTWQGGFVQE